MMKKILTILLALLPLMTWGQGTAAELNDGDLFTAETIEGVTLTYKVISAANKTCQVGGGEYNVKACDVNTTGTVTVPEVAKGFQVITVGGYAFSDCSKLTQINLPETIKTITYRAFSNCSGLTSFTIPNSVTRFDGNHQWNGCTGLTSIHIPANVTSMGNHTFANCPNILEVTVDENNPVFESPAGSHAIINKGKKSVVQGFKNTVIPEGITYIESAAFVGNEYNDIVLPKSFEGFYWDAFQDNAVHSITVAEGNTLFDSRNNCNALMETATDKLVKGCANTVIPANTKIIGEWAFAYSDFDSNDYPSLKTVVLPEGMTKIENWAFANCKDLEEVTIPSTVTEIMNNAFVRSDNMKTIVSYIQEPFALGNYVFDDTQCQNIILYVPQGTKSLYEAAEGWSQIKNIREIGSSIAEPYAVLSENNTVLTFYYDDQMKNRLNAVSMDPTGLNVTWDNYKSDITMVVFDESFANYTSLTSTARWFSNCTKLTTIMGIENLKTDNVTGMGSMFYGCSKLTNLDVSGFNTANVVSMSAMFFNCNSLTNLGVSKFNTANVTNMERMFYTCKNLIDIDLNNFNTSEVIDMSSMFVGCSSLKNLDLSNFNTAKVTRMDGMFGACTGLKTIYVGSDWSTAAVTSSSDMFANCTNLVGGAGTIYDANHVDYTYAHIDGGSNNPGYFTDKDAVDAPTFRFEGDNLVIETATKDASIFYQMADLPNMDEATIEKIKESLTVTADAQQSIYYEQPIELKKSVVLKAIAAGAKNSEVSTLVYDYDVWQKLMDAIWLGNEVWEQALDNKNVPSDLKDSLMMVVSQGQSYYDNRAELSSSVAENTIQRIYDYVYAVEKYLNNSEPEPYAVLSENNTVLTFYYDEKKEERNGMSVGPFNSEYEIGWHNYRSKIVTVVFDESFANCSSVTSTARWFYEFVNLTSVSGISNLQTDSVTNMYSMFSRCEKLTKLDLSSFDTRNVIDMSYMFDKCYSLTELIVSSFDTRNVTNMRNMFGNCSHLINLDVSSFNTSNVTNMCDMFGNCSSLTSLDVSGFNTSKVTEMTSMFGACSSLVSVNVDNFDTSNVENMEGMFCFCSSLTSVDLSHLNTANVKIMHNLFNGCIKLTDIIFGEFNTKKVTSMSGMFKDCSSLTSLDLSFMDTKSLYSIDNMFSGCSALQNINLSNFITKYINVTYEMFKGCHSLKELDLSSFSFEYSVYSMFDMFRDCTSLTTIYASSKWNPSEVQYGSGMFTNCISLVGGKGTAYDANHVDHTYAHIDGGAANPGYFTDKNATVISDDIIQFADANVKAICVQNWDTNGDGELSYDEAAAVTNISNTLFRDNKDIKSFDELQYFTGLTSIQYSTFEDCENLASVVIPTSVTSIGNDAFNGCSALTSIVVPNQVVYVGANTWMGCSNVKSVYIGSGLASVNVNPFSELVNLEAFEVSADNQHFASIDGILMSKDGKTLISYPAGKRNEEFVIVETITTVGSNAFRGCAYLKKLTVTQDSQISTDEKNGYWYIDSLEELILQEGVKGVGFYAFMGCRSLASIHFPSTLNYIGKSSFSGCGNISMISSEITSPFEFEDNVFTADVYNNAVVFVPDASLTLYRNTSGWRNFKNICPVNGFDVTFDSNGVLTVGSETTMADALEYVGGRAEVAKTITAVVWNNQTALANSDLQGLENPNMLVYVKDSSWAPANRDNVVIGDFAKSIVLTDVESGNNNFYCPQAFTAEMISYTRNFQQQTEIGVSRGWESIALPFTVQTIMHEKNGLIAPFGNDASGKHFWLRQLTQEGLARATTIEANTPYIISMPNNSEYPAEFNQAGRVTFSSQNAIVPVTSGDMASRLDPVTNTMIVFYPAMQRLGQNEEIYALNVGSAQAGSAEGSVFVAGLRDVRPFECYTWHHAHGPAPHFIPVDEMIGGATGIEDVRGQMSDGRSDSWYDLSGRKLQKKPTQNGVYILNGRRVIIK